MYNTNFKVKYNDIKEELIFKLKNKTDQEYIDNPDPEYEYSSQDILDICHKLYMDELSSVFYAENMLDNIIDEGIKYIFDKMLTNIHFKSIIDKMKELLEFNQLHDSLFDKKDEETNINVNGKCDFNLMVFLTLFSENIFYITHKCICQQLNTGIIDIELIQQLTENTITIMQN